MRQKHKSLPVVAEFLKANSLINQITVINQPIYYKTLYNHGMEWNEIKTNDQKIYPPNSITLFLMDTEAGLPCTCWVDKAYTDYPYKKNVCITVIFL